MNRRKLEDLGIWRGYGSSSIKARHPDMSPPAAINAWRPKSAPPI